MPSSLLPRTDVLLGSGDLMETVSAEGRALPGKGDTPLPTAGLHYKAGLCVLPVNGQRMAIHGMESPGLLRLVRGRSFWNNLTLMQFLFIFESGSCCAVQAGLTQHAQSPITCA